MAAAAEVKTKLTLDSDAAAGLHQDPAKGVRGDSRASRINPAGRLSMAAMRWVVRQEARGRATSFGMMSLRGDLILDFRLLILDLWNEEN